ncbi:Acb2/Tad1 domain-containing protein [Methylobacterium marchantiae]|uniref:Acb2/Tad1 hairpin domain-containing protein n=1 Tax=Methylobacterium marchantiae TaxID=600331 RepID=A0ABW3X1K5_9HYPH|nr:hypothetical protein AIGOOFII_3505 [Methylobacterium marchantiae]
MAHELDYTSGIPLSSSKGASLSESRRLEAQLDRFTTDRDMADKRLLAIARTNFELAFMALNKAIVKGEG